MGDLLLGLMLFIGFSFTIQQGYSVYTKERRIINIPLALTMNTLLGLGLIVMYSIESQKSKKEEG